MSKINAHEGMPLPALCGSGALYIDETPPLLPRRWVLMDEIGFPGSGTPESVPSVTGEFDSPE